MHQNLKRTVEASIQVKQKILLDENLLSQILNVSKICLKSIKSGGKIIFCGNGGSFADAQHLSAELTSRFLFNRPALASIVLGANSSSISAIGNDFGYDNVFSRELEALGSKKDILIAISTSGNSKNIHKVLTTADDLNIKSFVLTGAKGTSLKGSKHDCVKIPSHDTARIQECHILVGHFICEFIEREMFKNKRDI